MSIRVDFAELPIGQNLVVARDIPVGWSKASRALKAELEPIIRSGKAITLTRRNASKTGFDLILQRVKL